MQSSSRQVAAVEQSQPAAYKAYDRLVEAGIPRQRIEILAPGDPRTTEKLAPHPERTYANTALGAVVGLLGGAVVGALMCTVLWLLGVAAYVAYPWLAAGIVTAYAAGAGGIVGALVGSRYRRTVVPTGAKDAVEHGGWVVVVNARDRTQRDQAEQVLWREELPRAA